MNNQILDIKLKNLITVCKQSSNYKKLSISINILTRNLIFEIAVNLGVKPIEESPYKTMEFITLVFMKSLKVSIFTQDQIDTVRECEILFLENKGLLPLRHIKAMFEIYYDLRELDYPNLHKPSNLESMEESVQGGIFSFLAPKSGAKSSASNKLRPLILQKIREQEKNIKKELNSHFTSTKFESALYLNSLSNSLGSKKGKNKITLQGSLKDSISYQRSIEGIFGYLIIGVIFTLLSVGVIILLEMSMLPAITQFVDLWVLSIFVSVIILFFVYFKFIKKGCI